MSLRSLLLSVLLAALCGCGETSEDLALCEGVRCSAGTCQVHDGAATCVCSAYEQAAGVVCQDLGADPDEGDLIQTAEPLLPSSEPHVGVLQRCGGRVVQDVDVYAFAATAGQVYHFRTTLQPGMRVRVVLMDASGRLVKEGHYPIFSWPTARMAFLAPATGTYYFSVTSEAECGPGSVDAEYRILFEALGADDHPDEAAAATPLVAGPTQQGRLELGTDRDWFSFEAEAGHVYRFTCRFPTGGYCRLRLVDAQGQEVDADGGTTSRAGLPSFVAVEAPGAGSYRVELRRNVGDDDEEEQWGTYDYTLEDLGPDDCGDTPQGAAPLPGLSQWVTARIERGQDQDFFSVETEPGHIYRVLVQSPGSLGWTQVQDASGAPRSDSSKSFAGGGTRFVRIAPDGSTAGERHAFGLFTFQVVDLGPDDFGDSPETAAPLALGDTAGRFELSADRDVFALQLDPDRYYRITCQGCQLSLNTGSAMLRTAHDFEPGITDGYALSADMGGTAYATATPYGSSDYVLHLEDLGPDDVPDIAARAQFIALGSEVRGTLERLGDLDVFLVELTQGQSYTLSLDPGGFYARLTAPGGASWFTSTSGTPTFTAAESGTYVLSVYSEAPPFAPGTGSYRFTLR
ncbi:hypothetical protein FGE12_05245 [Aggregicoccus sp. 17bor-14]|uniref:hypothetical protein n=1 Tax=Myxococcaceae TaxID=31 RepID=UPI00129CA28F|nr:MULTISPECIES: hypothetical protein [Myxococcaceae]MBF5041786.1 hypothetical protein [Simulacricoccus sp. 17bor-14]MRI87567.1 hypothetical protein [Aggregicoccus sp. 17bor-14]